MSKHWLFILSLLFLALPVMAQKRRAVLLTPEQKAHKERMERMTANTQRIMFVDSMVVDKQQFLQHYRLSPEAGCVARFQDFFHTSLQPNAYIHVNELGNQCLMAQEAKDSTINLYSSQNIDNRWTHPEPLHGINDQHEFQSQNYPFMMGDGQTFYFAAKGGDSLGGYDIYVTRYDAEDNQFLHPANIGMPFNSEANDYMYAADEQSGIGYFVSDRRQPEGKVCVYIFILPETRRSYDPSKFTEQQIRDFADITRIADTWGNGSERRAALARLKAIGTTDAHPATETATATNTAIVINDRLTYTSAKDFRSPVAANHYRELLKARERLSTLEDDLQKSRDRYAQADENGRRLLRDIILHNEEQALLLHNNIHTLEKQTRKEENNNNK